jgi:Cu2+-exporting ATPase
VLVTRPDAIEALAKLDRVIFDKTGTLTRGVLRIERIEPRAGRSATECAAIAAALERDSEHPIARAFEAVRTTRTATEVKSIAGAGVEGIVDGVRYRLGTPAFVARERAERSALDDESTVVALADEYGIIAEFVLADGLRAGSIEIARDLAAMNIDSEILSGDGSSAVAAVAQRCRIARYEARCLPQQKLARVRELQTEGHTVAMVGDGINDAPVLGAADISISMGKGAALAQASADMILIGEDLSALSHAILTARKTLRIAKQNLYWAAAYNFGSLPLAALGFIPPWAAALGMSLSSVAVILNATRLLRTPAKPPARSSTAITPVAPAWRPT